MNNVAFKPIEKLTSRNVTGSIPKFTKNIFDWLFENGKFVYNFKSVSNNDVTMYTVPKDKVFYLTSLTLCAVNEATTSICDNAILIDDVVIFSCFCGHIDGGVGNNSISYAVPIVLREGQRLRIESNRVNSWCRATYSGYEIGTNRNP